MEIMNRPKEADVKRGFGISALMGTLLLVATIFLANGLCLAGESSAGAPRVPAKGMVTMVDLGASGCIPCEIMSHVVDSLQKKYQGKAAIYFINIRKYPQEAQKFGIKLIPTQIFYDKSGKEVYRHEGVMPEETVVAKLEELGVK